VRARAARQGLALCSEPSRPCRWAPPTQRCRKTPASTRPALGRRRGNRRSRRCGGPAAICQKAAPPAPRALYTGLPMRTSGVSRHRGSASTCAALDQRALGSGPYLFGPGVPGTEPIAAKITQRSMRATDAIPSEAGEVGSSAFCGNAAKNNAITTTTTRAKPTKNPAPALKSFILFDARAKDDHQIGRPAISITIWCAKVAVANGDPASTVRISDSIANETNSRTAAQIQKSFLESRPLNENNLFAQGAS
jgi:hypothetical protein